MMVASPAVHADEYCCSGKCDMRWRQDKCLSLPAARPPALQAAAVRPAPAEILAVRVGPPGPACQICMIAGFKLGLPPGPCTRPGHG